MEIARKLDNGESIEFVSKSKNESVTKSKAKLKATKDSVSKSIKDIVTESEGLSQNRLASRLSCSVHRLIDRRDNPRELADFTCGKDPEGVAWEYRDGKYYPQ